MPTMQETWKSLTKENTQVLICDLQKQIVARSKTTEPDNLAQSAGVLCQLAELFQIPITLSVVPEGNKDPELIKELKDFGTKSNEFLRGNANPFLDPKTTDHLKCMGRKTIVLAGFAIEVVVLHAALAALEQDFNVIVAVDACGGSAEQTEAAAIEHIRASGGLISSVLSVGTALSPDFTTDEGQKMFQIVQTLRLA